ncbi:unnamed protein product [Dicrocoelium dendriticum]|nr:unnamed protein product [Dicrocoelium dendriticum]
MTIKSGFARSSGNAVNGVLGDVGSTAFQVPFQYVPNEDDRIYQQYTHDCFSSKELPVICRTPSTSKDSKHFGQFNGRIVPPLNLPSRESSIVDVNDPLKGTLDIDMRSDFESDTIASAISSNCSINPWFSKTGRGSPDSKVRLLKFYQFISRYRKLRL